MRFFFSLNVGLAFFLDRLVEFTFGGVVAYGRK